MKNQLHSCNAEHHTHSHTMNLPTIKFAKTESLVLRCCRADMTSYGGFVWKKKGVVKAPDWKKNRDCRNGLHGWLSGQGHYDAWSASSDDLWSASSDDLWRASSDDLWMVVAVKTKDIIDLNGKVKFPAARVLYVGKREIATGLIVAHCPASKVIYGTVTAGDYGTATAGYGGTVTAGDYGIATAGEGGTATAGEGGILQINAWDSKSLRYRIIIGYVGENGLVAGTQYKLDEHAQFVEVA